MEEGAPVAYYHCVSRVVDRNFVLGDLEKEHFVKLMRGYEAYCGVRVLTFCIMTNHFHVLVEVPQRPRPEFLPSDSDLVKLVKIGECSYGATTLERRCALGKLASTWVRVPPVELDGSRPKAMSGMKPRGRSRKRDIV